MVRNATEPHCGRRDRAAPRSDEIRRSRGFTLLELVGVVSIFLVTVAIALPLIQNASNSYQMRSAVNSVTGIIQSTRYQAISNGYYFQIAFNSSNSTYQISNNTCGTATPCWVTVGTAEPLSNSSVAATINTNTTLLFHPGGQINATTGSLAFTLTYKTQVENITVSPYGTITVSP
jgi:Tfp pilus assembly protein FimT